ncbi:MAG: PEP-CTERM sorting domain-containing protein [Planctomycetota bacterium]
MLMLVFSMASLANATLIDVLTDGIGDAGHPGTSTNPLVVGETIALKIILNRNPYPGGSSYDGYVLDAMDLDLHISGAGSLGVVMKTTKTGDVPDLQHHADFDVWSQSDPLIEDNQIAQLMGGSMGYIFGAPGGGPQPEPVKLVWNLYIVGTGNGAVVIDLTLAGTTHYWDYSDLSKPIGPDKNATEGDLGDLTLYAVPEPVSIVLLGVGGLFLLRRRR